MASHSEQIVVLWERPTDEWVAFINHMHMKRTTYCSIIYIYHSPSYKAGYYIYYPDIIYNDYSIYTKW